MGEGKEKRSAQIGRESERILRNLIKFVEPPEVNVKVIDPYYQVIVQRFEKMCIAGSFFRSVENAKDFPNTCTEDDSIQELCRRQRDDDRPIWGSLPCRSSGSFWHELFKIKQGKKGHTVGYVLLDGFRNENDLATVVDELIGNCPLLKLVKPDTIAAEIEHWPYLAPAEQRMMRRQGFRLAEILSDFCDPSFFPRIPGFSVPQ